MTAFTISFVDLQALATLHHATPPTKKDREGTPILTAVQLTISAGRWTARATDRYIAAELSGDVLRQEGEDVTLCLESSSLAAAARSADRDAPGIFTTTEDGAVTIDAGLRRELKTVPGNFPPIDRLFPEPGSGQYTKSLALRPEYLARLGKCMGPSTIALKPAERAAKPLRLEPTGERSPILVTRDDAGDFRALMLPAW